MRICTSRCAISSCKRQKLLRGFDDGVDVIRRDRSAAGLQGVGSFTDDRVLHHFAGHLPERDEPIHRRRKADREHAELLVVRGGL